MKNGTIWVDIGPGDSSDPGPDAWAVFIAVANIMFVLYSIVKRIRAARMKVAMVKEIDGQKMGVMLRVCARMPRDHGSICYEIDPAYAPFPLDNPPTF